MHLGGQIPPDGELPPGLGGETEAAGFDDGENDTISSQHKAQQLLPLALTTGSKSSVNTLESRSTGEQSAANDAASVKTEESEGSTPSVSPPLTHNPPSAGEEDPLRLGDNAPADGSPVNDSVSSEEETLADLGSTSPFKAPLASSHLAVEKSDSEANDTPLSLCVSKPAVENDVLHRGVDNGDASSADKKPSPSSNPKVPAANAVPARIPPEATPETGEACGSVPQERDTAETEDKSETTTPSEPVADPQPDKDSPTEASEDREPCAAAPAPQQPPRPDKPYSCSHCGKAYASRSGLKVRRSEDFRHFFAVEYHEM